MTSASGKRRAALAFASVALVAASLAAGSRGGWLALACGGAIGLLLARRAGLRIEWKLVASLSAAVVAVVLGLSLLHSSTGGALTATLDSRSAISRLDLYQLAWKGVSVPSLLLGSGYLGFYYLLESARGGIAGYEESITYFVHNDYLQTLLELGVPGLAALLAVVALPQHCAWRAAAEQQDTRARLIAVGAAAALAAMAIHALVDFPFYVPVCLLMYGAASGLLDSLSASEAPIPLPRVLAAAFGTLAFWVLLTPVAAQSAAAHAHGQWRSAHAQSAAYWFEVARRIEPRDWRYHWYAGQFWYAQALETRSPEAARLAEAAFAAGAAANPRDVRNLLGRIATHARLRTLLAQPADAATLAGWCALATQLAPMDPQVKAEISFVEKQFGPGAGEKPR